jgi:hypothetical protein
MPSGSSGCAWSSSCRLVAVLALISEARDGPACTAWPARDAACDSASPSSVPCLPRSCWSCWSCVRCSSCVAAIADMFHDLNIPWTDATRELQRTVAFLDECEGPWVDTRGSWGASLTRCSRIRRDCPHTHLLGETASRPGMYKAPLTARLNPLQFDCGFTCAAPRVMAVANPSSTDISHHQHAPVPHATSPTYPATMQHLPDRRRLQLSHSPAATAIRSCRRPPNR